MVNKMFECKGYPVEVDKNSYLVFESKEKYKDVKSLEKELFDLVKNVLVKGINEEVLEMEREGYVNIARYESERESEIDKRMKYEFILNKKMKTIGTIFEAFSSIKVTIVELEKKENLANPFEVKFPTLVYYFMTNHKKEEEGYSKYNTFFKKIRSRGLTLVYDYLTNILAKAVEIKFEEKDMCNKMLSPAMLCKSNERGMRECDKFWKVKSEIQSTWDKIYILKYKPFYGIYTSIMKFRYIEDYKKMRRINEILGKIFEMMDDIYQPTISYKKQIDFIYKIYEETRKLEKLVKKCYFFDVDYDDGQVFLNKFKNINILLSNGEILNIIFKRLLRNLKYSVYDRDCENLYKMLKKEIYPSLNKIYHELHRRGIFHLE